MPRSDAADPDSDRELVRKLQAGNTDALAMLYDRYAPMVYTLALKMLQNAAEAEDLTQEAFVNFWQQQKYDPDRGSVGSYLATYTRSRALDRLRVGGGRRHIMKKVQRMTGATLHPPTPLEQAAQSERQQRLREALNRLSPAEREVLEIAYFEGLSQSQIAQRLGIPLGTVKTRSRQGLLRLRDDLGNNIL
ncbi:sigma-70 family RNA polymerase sigma factor [Halomicronema sp. CCY15110]|uniref:sigma-70 family RNA polymerase sigma factor n=1 Tax=Halomicronema sp. CCY15110 TaxID=2767773 RepID=UPI00194DF81A|nr:sigma-70 family RNA polymerase sigma factor [Halomicronema sp. CCY15110]